MTHSDKSFDTGFVPEQPGSAILYRRYFNAETGVGGQEWRIPWDGGVTKFDAAAWREAVRLCDIEVS